MASVELAVRDHFVEVWHKHRRLCTLAILDGRLQIRITDPEAIDITDKGSMEWEKLDVDISELVRPPEGTVMAQPKLVQTRARTRTIKATRPPKATSSPKEDSIDEGTSIGIRTAIISSLIESPNQTVAERKAATVAIAKRFRVSVMQVAGVRANLTRGTYGDPKRLLAKAKRAAN